MSRAGSQAAANDSGERSEQPIRALATLRRINPPPALVARVMTQVAEPATFSLWTWLRRPFRIEIRVSPLGAVGLGLGLIVGVTLFSTPRLHSTGAWSPSAAAAPAPTLAASSLELAPIAVRFVLEARGARRVTVAGSFNGWDARATELEDADQDGVFATTVTLPRGNHEYMFVVDGEWVTDPAAAERRPDGFGRHNSLLRL